MSSEEFEANEYHLQFVSVKMKVKFPCKMKLEHSSNTITDEVTVNQNNKFVFAQDVIIKEECEKQSFDVNVLLITEKGAKYVSGVIKLYHTELEKSEGQKIICPLTKCLDSDAFCEIKVNRVKAGKVPKRVSVSNSVIQLKRLNSNKDISISKNEERSILSPRVRKTQGVETRSELGMSRINGNHHDWQDSRSKGPAQTLMYKNTFLKSPKAKNNIGTGLPKMMSQFNHENEGTGIKEKFSESEVYKESFQKLKQKYKIEAENAKVEANKRIQLQANENNYKIQIMRLKLKTEEQEKIIVQKNQKINALQLTLSEINKKQLDMKYLNEENANLQHKVSVLNDSIHSLTKENFTLKKLSEERIKDEKVIIGQLREEIEAMRSKLEKVTIESQESSKKKTQRILSLETQLKAKNDTLDSQKNQIQKLETYMQNKLFDFEKTLQEEKNSGNSAVNGLKQKVELSQRQKKALESQIEDSKTKAEKMKAMILKVEYDKKVLSEQQQTIKKELLEFRSLKDKHSELTREIKFLKEDKDQLNKQLQATNDAKNVNMSELSEHYDSKVSYYKRQMKDLEEKVKNSNTAKIEVESQLEVCQASLEKSKRQNEVASAQVYDLKNKIKELKSYTNTLEQQNLTLQNEMSLLRNKMSFGEQTSRIESEKYKEQIQKLQLELGAENLKNVELNEVKNKLEIELGKKKIELQYADEKIEKLYSGNKELSSNLQNSIKDAELQSTQLQESISKLQAESKSLHEQMHKKQMEAISQNESIENLHKASKILEERVQYLESQLKARQQELSQAAQQSKAKEKTLNETKENLLSLRNQCNALKNEKSKNEKILQIRQKDLEQQRSNLQQSQSQKSKLEKLFELSKDQLKQWSQKYTRLEMKQRSTEREFNKFKDLMLSTIKHEYSKIPLLNSETPSTENLPVNGKHGDSPSSSQIQAELLGNITESKKTLFKLIEHNKQLKKEIETISSELEKDANKYQFTELELNRDIQQLQEEMHILYEEKEEELMNSDKTISELNRVIHEKEALIEELNVQCEELEYALSTIKLDFETNNDQNEKRVNTLKANIEELQEKLQHSRQNLSNQEDANHELEERLEKVKMEMDSVSEKYLKQIVETENLEAQKGRLEASLEQSTLSRKQLLERNNVLEICLNEEKGLKNKSRQLLLLQEDKLKKQKEFAATVIKEKQELIKSYLQMTDKILKLETLEIELNRDIEISSEQNQRLKSELQQIRESYRRESSNSRALEIKLGESETKVSRLEEKQQELLKEMDLKDEMIAKGNLKYKELVEKNLQDTIQFHSEIDKKYHENIDLSKETTQRITLLEAQVQELQHIKSKQHNDFILQGDELLAEKEQNELSKREIARLEAQIEQNSEEIQRLQLRVTNQEEELEQREENQQALNERIIVMEGEIETQLKDKQTKLQEVNAEWKRKYESMIEDMEDKLSVLSNERDLIRDQLEEKNAELELSLTQYRNSESGALHVKKNYEEKIRKIEEARLQALQAKNGEIKLLIEEKKALEKSVKAMEKRAQESSELLDSVRKRLAEEQKQRKEADEKARHKLSSMEQEASTLKRKQLQYSELRQRFLKLVWSNEREVKRVVQGYLKSILDQCDHRHIDKITNASKGMESVVVTAMMDKIDSL